MQMSVRAASLKADLGAIRDVRKAKGLTQGELALVSGVSERTVHVVEHGKETVQLAGLLRIVEALDLEVVVRERRSVPVSVGSLPEPDWGR